MPNTVEPRSDNRTRYAHRDGMISHVGGVAACMNDDTRLKLLRSRNAGVLATLMPDGRPQMSTITYGVDDGGPTIKVSITADRVKTRNLRRDPRAALHVSSPDGRSWLVAEGPVGLSAVAADRHDETVEELIDLYRAARSEEHPDWDDYRRAMVEDRRLVLRLHVDHTYGPGW